MCEIRAYTLNESGEEELYLEAVDYVRPEPGKVYLRSLFGEEKVFDGAIKEMRLTKNRMVLEKLR